MHNIPAEEMKYDGGQRYKIAVRVVLTLQMSAVIGTQRITPENVVADSLDELQKLLDRTQDRDLARELALENSKARQARRIKEIRDGTKKKRRGKKKRKQGIDDQRNISSNFSLGNSKSSYDTMLQSTTAENIDKATFSDTINWKERNAFMTRKTWHVNTGNSARVDHGLNSFSTDSEQERV